MSERMGSMTMPQDNASEKPNAPKGVFVVHGHDESMRGDVVSQLIMLGLHAIVLEYEINKGRTLTDKLIDSGDVGFAVVLLSPDDMGYSKSDGAAKARPRARQNVVFELGYFIGRIGKEKVLVLFRKEKDFEIPSD